MTLSTMMWTVRSARFRFATLWLVPVAIISLWLALTAFTLWEIGTLDPALRRLTAATAESNSRQRELAERPLLTTVN
ncbi:MAG TPA: hypothetical protein VG496_00845 [Myxococcales bacterium]|nr:hypothetical protein [Myxococcales bacterium]